MVSFSLLLWFDSYDRVSLNSPWLAWDSLCRPAWASTHRDLPASVVKIPGYSSRAHCFNSQQPMAAHDHLQFHARWRDLSSGLFGYQAHIWAHRHIGTTFIHMHLKKKEIWYKFKRSNYMQSFETLDVVFVLLASGNGCVFSLAFHIHYVSERLKSSFGAMHVGTLLQLHIHECETEFWVQGQAWFHIQTPPQNIKNKNKNI